MSSKVKAIALILGCVLIGFILGILIDRTFFAKYHHRKMGLKEYRKELIKRLDLDKNQQVRLDSILSWSQNEFRNLSKEFRPKFDSLKSALRDSIRSILTPQQIEKFEKMIKEAEKMTGGSKK